MIIRFRHRLAGAHVHCRVFTSLDGVTFAKCGDLVFAESEWSYVMLKLGNRVQFVPDGPEEVTKE